LKSAPELRFGLFGIHGRCESQKCLLDKGLGCGKVLGFTEIGIVNARESETQKLPRLTSAASAWLMISRPGGTRRKGAAGYVVVLRRPLSDYSGCVVSRGADNKGFRAEGVVGILGIHVFIRASIRGSQIAQVNIWAD
jgi:hypothetical protein